MYRLEALAVSARTISIMLRRIIGSRTVTKAYCNVDNRPERMSVEINEIVDIYREGKHLCGWCYGRRQDGSEGWIADSAFLPPAPAVSPVSSAALPARPLSEGRLAAAESSTMQFAYVTTTCTLHTGELLTVQRSDTAQGTRLRKAPDEGAAATGIIVKNGMVVANISFTKNSGLELFFIQTETGEKGFLRAAHLVRGDQIPVVLQTPQTTQSTSVAEPSHIECWQRRNQMPSATSPAPAAMLEVIEIEERTISIYTFGLETLTEAMFWLCEDTGGGHKARIHDDDVRNALEEKDIEDVNLVYDVRRVTRDPDYRERRRRRPCRHIGIHPFILQEMLHSEHFDGFFTKVKRQINFQFRLNSTDEVKVAMYCKSGRHRSVAAATFLWHFAEFEGWVPKADRERGCRFVSCINHLSKPFWDSTCKGLCNKCRDTSWRDIVLGFALGRWKSYPLF